MGQVAWTAKVKHASRTKCLLEGGKKHTGRWEEIIEVLVCLIYEGKRMEHFSLTLEVLAKICHTATLSTTNPERIGLGSSLGRQHGDSPSHGLIHGSAFHISSLKYRFKAYVQRTHVFVLQSAKRNKQTVCVGRIHTSCDVLFHVLQNFRC